MLLPVGEVVGADGYERLVEDGGHLDRPHQKVLHLRDDLQIDVHIHNGGDDTLNMFAFAILNGDNQNLDVLFLDH